MGNVGITINGLEIKNICASEGSEMKKIRVAQILCLIMYKYIMLSCNFAWLFY